MAEDLQAQDARLMRAVHQLSSVISDKGLVTGVHDKNPTTASDRSVTGGSVVRVKHHYDHNSALAGSFEEIDEDIDEGPPPPAFDLIGKQVGITSNTSEGLITADERDAYFSTTSPTKIGGNTPTSKKFLQTEGGLPANRNYKNASDFYEFRIRWWLSSASESATANKTIVWRQKSWIASDTLDPANITDDNCMETRLNGVLSGNASADCAGSTNALMVGLAKSNAQASCLIDGNGAAAGWWNCAGAVTTHTLSDGSEGIPCYDKNVCRKWMLSVRRW
eukprot:gnl/MRDRNA2_/MRDRNA2_18524_c0_seq1.p1 gnl/MRDRNA2_/MRDRNA2_18524_c0~~gnl/MRDRNA2_/MRDRNA2_18524_c0_seq1.p1  ORF type:complete len:320 (+),score=39.98 gnl/MRDRNA2_/MRDRNA2_18524_c0_seq1:128-961(+)